MLRHQFFKRNLTIGVVMRTCDVHGSYMFLMLRFVASNCIQIGKKEKVEKDRVI